MIYYSVTSHGFSGLLKFNGVFGTYRSGSVKQIPPASNVLINFSIFPFGTGWMVLKTSVRPDSRQRCAST